MPTIRDTPVVGSAEAAKLLEIGPTNFSHLRKKLIDAGDEHFPQPTWQLQCGPIWLETDMLKFKKHYDSTRRRVRSSNGDAAVAPAPPVKAPKAAKTTAKAPPKPRGKSTTDKMVDSRTATVTTIGSKPTAAKTLKIKPSAKTSA